MATLKLPPSDTRRGAPAQKKPVRRPDPAKRVRTPKREDVTRKASDGLISKTAEDVEIKHKRRDINAPSRDQSGDRPLAGKKSGVVKTDQNRKPSADRKVDFPRLSKRMSELGLCSRREADEWIANGWVKVNSKVVDVLGARIPPDARIEISKEAERHQSESVTILLHKPVGYVSGQAEDGYEPAVVLVRPENQWADDYVRKPFQRHFLKGLAPAGRLDIDSTGLLVLTQDGRVARHLIGEDSTIEKEYLVRVEGKLSEAGLKLLNHGLELDGAKLKPAKVSWQNEDQLRFVLREGKKRQIRRMCELVGLHVVGLKRVRIGSVTLGKLPLGQWRYLRPGERF